MIQAFIFDLDGTLVNTEPLKNLAYACVARQLAPGRLSDEEVMAVASELIGVPAPETAMELVRRLDLEDPARARMRELGASAPWQVFSQLHTSVYNQLLDEPGVLQRAQLPHTVALLHEVRQRGFKTGLATMSYRPEAQRVLDILGWTDLFDVVATANDVQCGKPDPEIYLLVARTLAVLPRECLVIEDSPSGVRAALAAGMTCIAVPTDLTRAAMNQALDQNLIVDDPGLLRIAVEQRVAVSNRRHGLEA